MAGDKDGLVVVYSAATLAALWECHLAETGGIEKLRVSSDSAMVFAGSFAGPVFGWAAGEGGDPTVFEGHTGDVSGLRMAGPNEEFLVTSARDGDVRLWDRSDGRCVSVLREHVHGVSCLAVDGDRIYSAGRDKKVKVWPGPPHSPEAVGDGPGPASVATFEPHGGGIRGLVVDAETNTLYAGGFDFVVHAYDLKVSDSAGVWG